MPAPSWPRTTGNAPSGSLPDSVYASGRHQHSGLGRRNGLVGLTRVANTREVNLDADLVRLGRGNLDVLDAQVLSGLPGHGGLASDWLRGVEGQRPLQWRLHRHDMPCLRLRP